MKISILLSVATVGIAFVDPAHAQFTMKFPSPSECFARAGSDPVAQEGCFALKDCMDNHSDDYDSLHRCTYRAYHRTHRDKVMREEGSGMYPSFSLPSISSPISTDNAESDYMIRDGRKGYQNAQVGGL